MQCNEITSAVYRINCITLPQKSTLQLVCKKIPNSVLQVPVFCVTLIRSAYEWSGYKLQRLKANLRIKLKGLGH